MTEQALVGVPYDASSSFLRGAALAPLRIREALWTPAGNPFSEALIDLSARGAVADVGDLVLGESRDARDARDAITEGVDRLIEAGGRPIALGGDHSVTYPIVRAVRRSLPRLTILHVDAHPDLNDVFEGDRFSHACPFARILEERLADRLIQIGIRTMTRHQREQADRFGVEVIDMKRWVAGERPAWNPVLEGAVYVSIDLDGLDPAFAPGVSHREAGGRSVREVLTEIQRLAGPIVGADVVEYNPLADLDGHTAPVAAKLVKELASRMIETG
jgi:agmatinase